MHLRLDWSHNPCSLDHQLYFFYHSLFSSYLRLHLKGFHPFLLLEIILATSSSVTNFIGFHNSMYFSRTFKSSFFANVLRLTSIFFITSLNNSIDTLSSFISSSNDLCLFNVFLYSSIMFLLTIRSLSPKRLYFPSNNLILAFKSLMIYAKSSVCSCIGICITETYFN